jgi:hypothetical protein
MSAPTDWSLPAKTNRQVGQEHEVRTYRPFLYTSIGKLAKERNDSAEGTCEAATLIKDFETRPPSGRLCGSITGASFSSCSYGRN